MSTLGTLVDTVSYNLGDTNLSYYTAAEIKEYIGEAYRKYTLMMIKAASGFFTTKVNLSLVASQEAYDLSALDPVFLKLSKIERNTTIGTVPLEPSERRTQINSPYLAGAGYLYQPTYRIRGMNLILEPQPMASETVTSSTGVSTTGIKIEYVYEPDYPNNASADAFTFDSCFPTTFEPLITLSATISALQAKDAVGGVSDINSFTVRLAQFESEFIEILERNEAVEGIPYSGYDYSTGGF